MGNSNNNNNNSRLSNNNNNNYDIDKAIVENDKIAKEFQEFKYFYDAVSKKLTDFSRIKLNTIVLGYKIVRLVNKGYIFEGSLLSDTCAILTLGIDIDQNTISCGNVLSRVPASRLEKNVKYCTDSCVVIGVQIISTNQDNDYLLESIASGQTQLVSNFNEKFIYELGNNIIEPNFGKPGKGCIQGIHFFINKEKALTYVNTGFINHKQSDSHKIAYNLQNNHYPVFISDPIYDVVLPDVKTKQLNAPEEIEGQSPENILSNRILNIFKTEEYKGFKKLYDNRQLPGNLDDRSLEMKKMN